MADRYWVGGTGTWDGVSTTNWAATSGGAAGASAPTAADAVFFDGNSGTGTATITASTPSPAALSINCTGYGGTIAGTAAITVSGSITLVTGMTWSYTGTLTSNATATITSAGKTFGPITKSTASTTLTFADDFTSTGALTWSAGTIDFTDKTISFNNVDANNTGVKSIVFGTNGLVKLTGTGNVWNQQSGSNSISSTGSRNVEVTNTTSTATSVSVGGASTSSCLNWSFTGGSYALNAAGQFRNMNFTGFSGSIGQANTRSIFGDLTLSSTCTISSGTSNTFNGTGTQTIRSNGRTVDIPITQNGAGGTLRLLDSLTMGSARTFTLTNGTLDLNGNTLTVGTTGTFSTAAGTKNITFNGGVLVCPNGSLSAFNNAQPTNFTTTAGTGTGEIRMTAAGAKTFVGGGSTFNCTLTNNGAGALTITGSNTFTALANGVSPTTFSFTAGTTTTLTTWSINGTAGNLVIIQSATAASHTLSKASGTVSANYLSITNSTATGGATWSAANSTDGGGNSGWNFGGGPIYVDGQATIDGIGSVTALGLRIQAGQAAIDGIADLAAAAQRIQAGQVAIDGIADLAAAAQRIQAGQVAIDGIADLTAAAQAVLGGSAFIEGVGSVTPSAVAVYLSAAAIDGSGSVVVAGGLIQDFSVVINSAGEVQITGTIKWTQVPDGTETWNQAADSATTWIPVSAGSEDWTRIQ